MTEEICPPCKKNKPRVIAYLDFKNLPDDKVIEDYDYIMDGLTNIHGLSEIQAEQLVTIAMTHPTRRAFLAEGVQGKVLEVIQPLVDLKTVPITIENL